MTSNWMKAPGQCGLSVLTVQLMMVKEEKVSMVFIPSCLCKLPPRVTSLESSSETQTLNLQSSSTLTEAKVSSVTLQLEVKLKLTSSSMVQPRISLLNTRLCLASLTSHLSGLSAGNKLHGNTSTEPLLRMSSTNTLKINCP